MTHAIPLLVEDQACVKGHQLEWNRQDSEHQLAATSGDHLRDVRRKLVWDSVCELGPANCFECNIVDAKSDKEACESMVEAVEQNWACKSLRKWSKLTLISWQWAINKSEVKMVLEEVLSTHVPVGNCRSRTSSIVEIRVVHASDSVELLFLVLRRCLVTDTRSHKEGFLASKSAHEEPDLAIWSD